MKGAALTLRDPVRAPTAGGTPARDQIRVTVTAPRGRLANQLRPGMSADQLVTGVIAAHGIAPVESAIGAAFAPRHRVLIPRESVRIDADGAPTPWTDIVDIGRRQPVDEDVHDIALALDARLDAVLAARRAIDEHVEIIDVLRGLVPDRTTTHPRSA